MSVATAITALSARIQDAYDAIESKGGEMPPVKNSYNLSAAIDSIPQGGGPTGNNIIQFTATGMDCSNPFIDPLSATNVSRNSAFYKNTFIQSYTAPNIQTASVNSTYEYAFNGATSISYVSFPALKTVSGMYAFRYFMNDNRNNVALTVDFPELTAVTSSNAFQNAFAYFGATSRNTLHVNMPKLKTISGTRAFQGAFNTGARIANNPFENVEHMTGDACLQQAFTTNQNPNLTVVSFPYLTDFGTVTTQFGATGTGATYDTFYNNTNITEIHFRADVQSKVEGLGGYSRKFGATNATIYFDL